MRPPQCACLCLSSGRGNDLLSAFVPIIHAARNGPARTVEFVGCRSPRTRGVVNYRARSADILVRSHTWKKPSNARGMTCRFKDGRVVI